MKGKLLSVLIVVLLLTIVFSGCFENKNTNIQEVTLPDIVIAHSTGLRKLIYDKNTKTYLTSNSANSYAPSKIQYSNNTFFILEGENISRLNNNFVSEKKITLNNIGSFAVHNKNLYVSYNNSFASFNNDLEKLESFELNMSDYLGYHYTKNAHDIAFYENNAYLLDNILYPVFILIVDIENPEDMQIKNTTEIWGINPHLMSQCLIPESNYWLIVETSSTMGGYSQSIDICSMVNGNKLVDNNVDYTGYSDEISKNLTLIQSITETSPLWAVISKNNSTYVAKPSYDANKSTNITFSDLVDINIKPNSSFRSIPKYLGTFVIKNYENYLFITYANKLIVVDVEKEPTIILSQEISGISLINDFAML